MVKNRNIIPRLASSLKVHLYQLTIQEDKYLFYQHWRRDTIAFWEEGLVDNFNFSDPPYTHREEAKLTLFNTSHIRIQKMGIEAFELDETEGQWPYEIWSSYETS